MRSTKEIEKDQDKIQQDIGFWTHWRIGIQHRPTIRQTHDEKLAELDAKMKRLCAEWDRAFNREEYGI